MINIALEPYSQCKKNSDTRGPCETASDFRKIEAGRDLGIMAENVIKLDNCSEITTFLVYGPSGAVAFWCSAIRECLVHMKIQTKYVQKLTLTKG